MKLIKFTLEFMKHSLNSNYLVIILMLLSCTKQDENYGSSASLDKYLNNEYDSSMELIKEEIEKLNSDPTGNQLKIAMEWNNMACLFFAKKKLTLANQYFNKSRRSINDSDINSKAVILVNVGGYYYKTNLMSHPQGIRKSMKYFDKAIDLMGSVNEENYRLFAKAMSFRGLLNIELGKYDLADKDLSKAVEIFEQFQEKSVEYANALDNLGLLYMTYLSRMDHAFEFIKKSNAIKDDNKKSHYYEWLNARGNLIAYYDFLVMTQKEVDEEELSRLKQEYEEAEKAAPNEKATLKNYGSSKLETTMFVERILPYMYSKDADILDVNNLSSMDEVFGEGSEDSYTKMLKKSMELATSESFDPDSEMGKLLNSLKAMGEMDEEELQKFMNNASANSSGLSYEEKLEKAGENYSNAIAEAQANGTYSKEMQKKLSEEYSANIEKIISSQGQELGEQILSNFDANKFLVEMMDMTSNDMNSMESGSSSNLHNEWAQSQSFAKASAYRNAGDHEKAIEQYEIYIEQLKDTKGLKGGMYVFQMIDLSKYAYSLEKYEISSKYILKAFDTEIETYNNLKYISEKERKAYWFKIQMIKDGIFMMSKNLARLKPEVVQNAYDVSLETKAQLLAKTSKMRYAIENSGDEQLKDVFKNWVEFRSKIAKGAQLSLEDRLSEGYDLEDLEAKANKLEKSLSDKSDLFQEEVNETRYNWRQIKRALKENEVAIEIIKFSEVEYENFTVVDGKFNYAAMMITKESGSPKFIEIPNTVDLEGKFFNAYRSFNHASKARGSKVISNKSNNAKRSNVDKSELYNAYWKPIQKALPNGTKNIFISGSGVYNSINLNTLYNTNSKKYLLDEYNISYLSSTRELISNNASMPVNSTATIALFGYPLYKMENQKYDALKKEYSDNHRTTSAVNVTYNSKWVLLPGTLNEVNKVSDLFKSYNWNVEKFIENRAIEEQVKALRSPSIIHIATHGEFKTDNSQLDPMLRSGLIFAGFDNYASANSKPKIDDGILTAFEASTLSLDNTELAVLSACETGLGQSESGEGVYGLQRAFKIAGVNTLLMSLWQVNDEATEKLMVNFYQNLLKTGNKQEAFVNAQKTVKLEYEDPYYWGAFVLVD